jgi:hypothetical protein
MNPKAKVVHTAELNAKGTRITLECFQDGDVLLTLDNQIYIEFDKKDAVALADALRKRASGRGEPSGKEHASMPARPAEKISHRRVPNRNVFKEGEVWGASVFIAGREHRYYYDKRDHARAALPEHKIGEAGRVA